MEMLPYELNPVIVTAKIALQDIYRVLETNRKRILATFSEMLQKRDNSCERQYS
jgi:hypothetical protein